MDKGFKPTSTAPSNSKPKSKKKTVRSSAMAGKELNFIIPQPEFPDLSAIDAPPMA
jgi:hypothetical protein